MKELINYLITKDEKYKDILITGAEYDLSSNVLRIKSQYTCDIFTDEAKEHLEKCIFEFFDKKIFVECKMKKYAVDNDVVIEYVVDYLSRFYPSAVSDESVNNIEALREEGLFIVKICLEKDNYDYLNNTDFIEELKHYLEQITIEEFDIQLQFVEGLEEANDLDILKQRYAILGSSEMNRVMDYEPIEVKNIHNIIGEIDVDFVYPIATISEQDKAIMVGSLSNVRVVDCESRFKNKDGTSRMTKRVNFNLNDGSAIMSCVYFPAIADMDKLESIVDGEKVVIVGDVKDSEEHGTSCRVKSIALCSFDSYEEQVPEIEIKTVNEQYNYVFPKPYLINEQSVLFAEEDIIDNFLMQNDVVVFDLETTGLNINECEIVEIGAVKIVGGKIVETFDTLIKPKLPIPEEATAVNNITNDMVQNCLGIDLIFPDFYKFIDGSVLVAYNISYDYGVLKAYGDRNGFIINNPQLDALKLAKKALPNRGSYKLARVVKALEIELENAHRALFDTIATAKLFKKTLIMLNEKDREELLNI